MYPGYPLFCLKSSDLTESKRFYQALGMEVVDELENRVVLRRGSFCFALMTFLDDDLLNFRGEDAFAVQAHLARHGLFPPGEPERYRKEQHDADADGACWATVDPEGRALLFDTNQNEVGPVAKQRRITQLLRNTEQDLLDVGASDACLAAFREHVLSRFGSPDSQSE